MESVKSARRRLQMYPKLVAECGPQAAAYGKCVAAYLGEVKKGQCQEEFRLFMDCVGKSAKKLGTKL